MIIVKKPSKKRDYYSGKVETPEGTKIKETLRGVKCLHLTQLSNGCTLVRVWVPNDSTVIEKITEYDEDVCATTILKNGEWFPNRLTEKQVRTYFQPSIHASYSTMIVMFHPWKPASIFVDGKIVESLDSIESEWWTKDYSIHMEIEIESVCFYRQKFGIRWVVRRIWIDRKPMDTGEDWVDREAVYESWRYELDNFHKSLEKSKEELRLRMQQLDQFEEKMVRLWEEAGFVDGVEWNQNLEKLSKSLAKYQTGSLEMEI